MTTKHTLTIKQQKAIQSLLNGRTKSQTAADIGVNPRTLTRWLTDPAFNIALTAAADQALTDAAHRLAGSLDHAVSVLTEVIADKDARDTDRLRAASLIIHRGLDLIQQKQLIERLAALEARINAYQEL